jgi:Ca2+-binding EF-hand superfamily protein
MSFTVEELEEWFKDFDADGSGKIDAQELRAVVKSFREWQNQEADDAKVDSDVGVKV